jgi:hypothetical protein
MADEVVAEVAVKSIEEQIAELEAKVTEAAVAKDYKLVGKLAQQLNKLQADQKGAEQKAKQDALVKVTGSVGEMFTKLVSFLTGGQSPDATEVDEFAESILNLEGTELDKADGVWYANDFSAESGHATSIKLMKGQTKAKEPKAPGEAKATGTGGGQKYSVKTEDLIAELGDMTLGDGTEGTIKAGSAYAGMTVKAAQESSTDKNWRYGLRIALLKFKGVM